MRKHIYSLIIIFLFGVLLSTSFSYTPSWSNSTKWGGVFGNISSDILLGNGLDNMLKWHSEVSYIFFVNSNDEVELNNLIPANSTIVDDVNPNLDTGTDAWSQVFNNFTLSSNGLIPENTPYTITNPTSSGFATFSLAYLLPNGNYTLVWAGNISQEGSISVDGSLANYQVMLPNGTFDIYFEMH